jgi:outer membrane protein assembly factor BamB
MACLLTAAAFAATPSIKLSKTSGPPTTNITVSGSGFAASSLIDIYFDTTDMVLVVSSTTGTFSKIPLQVPAAAQPGTHWVTAGVRATGSAAQKSFLVRTNWTEFGFTSKNKRSNPYENALNPSTVGSIDLDWSFTTGAAVESSPAVANGVVYVGSYDGNVYALNATTGAKLWSFTTADYVLSSPAVANGVVYVGSDDSNVYALNASTGAKLWSFTTGSGVLSSPAVANGVVYVGSYDGNVYALNATTGAKLWSFATSYPVYSSPAVANGVVYVGSYLGYLYALNANTGAELWSWYNEGSSINVAPAVANGVVYVPDIYGCEDAVNATTGEDVGGICTKGAVESSAAVANGVVYVASDDYNLYAFRGDTVLWTFGGFAGEVFTSPAVANGVVYVGSTFANVYALNASTGAVLWSFATSGAVYSSPAVANGVVYVGSDDFKLYAFDQAGGLLAKRNAAVTRPDPATLIPNYSLVPSKP